MAYLSSTTRSNRASSPATWTLLALVAMFAGCRDGEGDAPETPAEAPKQAERGPWALDEVPDELRPRVERGMQAMDAVQARLFQALGDALGEGPASGALEVCSEIAQPLTAEVAAEAGIEVGRTSLKIRNPENEPEDWVRPWLKEHWQEPAAGIMPMVVDLGDAIGIARPIGTMDLCETCHGPEEALAAELRESLERLYPEDQAVGFMTGDLRGAFWAKVAE